MDGRIFTEKQIRTVERQISVHFIRADLMEALNTVFPACIHKYRSTYNIGLQKDGGVLNRAVHMRLRRKIDHDIRMLLFEDGIYSLPVAYVLFIKDHAGGLQSIIKRMDVCSICKSIDTDYVPVRTLLQKKIYEV